MSLPADLLTAVSAPGGGKITLVVGAGCSFEAPTSIPLAGQCSTESHQRLLADGILAAGDCGDPSNLSSLADAVFAKTGRQEALVRQLSQNYAFKTATPNEGHRLAAALLREGAISSVVTLNFDLALSVAISELGVGDTVAIIDGPDDLPAQKAINLYYLHRNVNAADLETWILRTADLNDNWKTQWEGVVVNRVLSTPIVIFAGLGSTADVLVETAKFIKAKIPNGNKLYQVDPGDPNNSPFFTALGLDRTSFIKTGWCEFMADLSQRLVVEQTAHLTTSATTIVARECLTVENLGPLMIRLQQIGLVSIGRLRAHWLLHKKHYYHDEPIGRELIADLLIGIAMIERETGSTAVLFDDGVVEFRRGDRVISSYVCVSGSGTRSQVAIEGELSTQMRRYRARATPPAGVIVAGARNTGAATPPPSIILDDISTSIITGPSAIPFFQVETLRQNPQQCMEVAP